MVAGEKSRVRVEGRVKDIHPRTIIIYNRIGEEDLLADFTVEYLNGNIYYCWGEITICCLFVRNGEVSISNLCQIAEHPGLHNH